MGVVIFSAQDCWTVLNNRLLELVATAGLDQVQGLMDRFLEQNNRERVRNTMIKQEEMFKEQVHELHRLYQIQKMLMAEVKTNEAQIHSRASVTTLRAAADTKNKYWSSTSTSETSHSSYISSRHQNASQFKSEYGSHQHSLLANELQWPTEEGANVSHVRSKQSWADEECDVDLSLSIGSGSSKKKQPQSWLQPETTRTSEMRQLVMSNTGTRTERGDECSEKESLKRPPWLFQAMSLNRT